MINKINIQNYKSIIDLEIDIGKVNLLIGSNGSGKTNILEAIAFASAAHQNKLDDEYLGRRMRLTHPDFMRSVFEDNDNPSNHIRILITESNKLNIPCDLTFNPALQKWVNNAESIKDDIVNEIIKRSINDDTVMELFTNSLSNKRFLFTLSSLDSFLIFSPEETNLRKFSDETMIRPLGRRGEGMFKHLKELLSNGDKEIMKFLNAGLSLLDWFKEFVIPKDLFTQESRLDIADKYVKETKQFFDQQSTNEGFLFLLFYLILFNSPKTPSFFAIDNIETSLNPKLAKRFLQHLIEVTKRTDKQVIISTHNPYVLDGLDLSDDEQRLFVVRRNIDGHTKVSRIPYTEQRKLPLSQVWMSGVLGGLPDNF